MAECGWTRRLAALVPVVFALFLGLSSIQSLALAQEAPPSDEEPAAEDPPADEKPSPASDGGEDPASDSSDGSDGKDSPPSDGGEAPSDDPAPANSGGGDSSASSGDGDASATRTSSSTNGNGKDSETLKNKLRRLVAASTKGSNRRDHGEGVASAADGDLGELVAGGEGLVGGDGGKAKTRVPSAPGTVSARLALTGATVLGQLGAALALIVLGMLLLWWDRAQRVLIQIAASLPVL